MISRRQFLGSATATCFAASGLVPLISSPASAKSAKNINYGDNRLDVYSPDGVTNAPIIMFVHGGAWLMGNKSMVGRKPRFFTDKGFVFVSVGYTLFPVASVETQASQIGQAVQWVRENAHGFGGDRDRIALIGHSAGCHLASLSTLSGLSTGVRALLCNDTRAYDLHELARTNHGGLPALYAAPFSKRENWTRWSPITYSASMTPKPPTMVLYSGGSGRDRLSLHFAGALADGGMDVSKYDGRRYNHGSINSRLGAANSHVSGAVIEFIDYAFAKPLCPAGGQSNPGPIAQHCKVPDGTASSSNTANSAAPSQALDVPAPVFRSARVGA